MKILVIHGPNLNLLGIREPEIYGTKTLDELNGALAGHARERGVELETFQSNHEGEIIDRIQAAGGVGGLRPQVADAIVINPGAFTHTSLAIADAISGTGVPAVEVHLSDIRSRGELRSRSLIADVCVAQIAGRGFDSYFLGMDAAIEAVDS
ncbi:MAG: type II 3-dehydroquinate dehydratase [Candidatus Latescibacterota bacterium]|jgi:3-dehydroquinate dehydratase-2